MPHRAAAFLDSIWSQSRQTSIPRQRDITPLPSAETFQRVGLAETQHAEAACRLTGAIDALAKRTHVLVVDDNLGVRLSVKVALRHEAHVAAFSTREAGIEAARCIPFDVALVDSIVGDLRAFTDDLKAVSPSTTVVLISGGPAPADWDGPHVTKPASAEELRTVVVAARGADKP